MLSEPPSMFRLSGSTLAFFLNFLSLYKQKPHHAALDSLFTIEPFTEDAGTRFFFNILQNINSPSNSYNSKFCLDPTSTPLEIVLTDTSPCVKCSKDKLTHDSPILTNWEIPPAPLT